VPLHLALAYCKVAVRFNSRHTLPALVEPGSKASEAPQLAPEPQWLAAELLVSFLLGVAKAGVLQHRDQASSQLD